MTKKPNLFKCISINIKHCLINYFTNGPCPVKRFSINLPYTEIFCFSCPTQEDQLMSTLNLNFMDFLRTGNPLNLVHNRCFIIIKSYIETISPYHIGHNRSLSYTETDSICNVLNRCYQLLAYALWGGGLIRSPFTRHNRWTKLWSLRAKVSEPYQSHNKCTMIQLDKTSQLIVERLILHVWFNLHCLISSSTNSVNFEHMFGAWCLLHKNFWQKNLTEKR